MAMYRIKNWDEHFENSASKKVDDARWLPLPNKHDGKGYRRVAQHPESIKIFCGWTLILQIASKMPKRGILADSDGPLSTEDMSVMTGFPAEVFEVTLKVLSDNKIGWICDDSKPDKEDSSGSIRMHPDEVVSETAPSDRMEGNGREGKRRERKSSSPNGETVHAKKPAKVADPNHRPALLYFVAAWEAKYGASYGINSKEAKHIEQLLGFEQIKSDLQKFKSMIDRYLADDSQFYVKDRHSLGLLVSQYRRFAIEATENDPDAFNRKPYDPDTAKAIIGGLEPIE